jgi:hypothetical protein
MARELSAAPAGEQVAQIGERFVASTLRGKASMLILGEDEQLRPAAPARVCSTWTWR